MANKYQVDNVRRIIVERLESDWPCTLLSWRILEAEIEVMKEYAYAHAEPNDDMFNYHLDRELPEPVSAIRLAYECNVPRILPAAYYQLSRLTVEHDSDSIKDYEAAIMFICHHGMEQRTARWSLLEKADLMRLLIGKAKLQQSPSVVLPPCSSNPLCDLKGEYIQSLWDRIEKYAASDVLHGHEELLKEITERSGVCQKCRVKVKDRLDCEAIWEKLPEYFMLT